MVGIYKVTNLINGKCYVGQSKNIQRRFWEHRCISHEGNKNLRKDLIQFGKENFSYDVIEECSIEQLDEKEKFWISKINPEYNTYNGGKAAFSVSEHIREQLRLAGKRQWNEMSKEEKEKVIKYNLKGPRIGHSVSESAREKLRKANLGKKQSEETLQKRAATMKKKKENGYVRDSRAWFKSVRCIENDTIYESVKAAANALNVPRSGISAVLHKRQETTGGLHFEYWKCRD